AGGPSVTLNDTGPASWVTAPPTRCANVTVYRPGTTYGPTSGSPNSSSISPRGRFGGSWCAGARKSQATRCSPFSTGPVITRTGVPAPSLTVSSTAGGSSSTSARSSSAVG